MLADAEKYELLKRRLRLSFAMRRVFTTGTSADRCPRRCSTPFPIMDRQGGQGRPRMLVVATYAHGRLCIVCAESDPAAMYTKREMRQRYGPKWRQGQRSIGYEEIYTADGSPR